ELPFSLFRVEDPSEIEADAPFAILSSYGKADAAAVGELAGRVPTVVYAVQVRAGEPAPLMRALAYVSDRMPGALIRDVIVSAVCEDPPDSPARGRADLVEQLHRLDEADDLAHAYLRTHLNVRLGLGRGRPVEHAGERRAHRRQLAVVRSRRGAVHFCAGSD